MSAGEELRDLTTKRKRVGRSTIVKGMADGGTFTTCINLLRVHCSLRNSNGSRNSVGSHKGAYCLGIYRYLHHCDYSGPW